MCKYIRTGRYVKLKFRCVEDIEFAIAWVSSGRSHALFCFFNNVKIRLCLARPGILKRTRKDSGLYVKLSVPSRRRTVRLIAVAFAVLALIAIYGCSQQWAEMQSFVMSTVLEQQVEGSGEVCAENLAIAQNLENKLSRTIQSSEISKMRESDGMIPISKDTEEVLRAAVHAWQATGGAFDPALGAFRDAWDFLGTPHVPDQDELKSLLEAPGAEAIVVKDGEASAGGADIDLGGAGKGIALDRMREAMQEKDVSNAIVSFGGAVLTMGHRPDGGKWRVGVKDAFAADSWVAVVEMTDTIVETSGISEQSFTENGVTYNHILDPATGMPADNGLVSVSVAADSGLDADIMSTALFVMGPVLGTEYAEENGIKALFVNGDKEIWTTSWFDYGIDDIDPSYTLI